MMYNQKTLKKNSNTMEVIQNAIKKNVKRLCTNPIL